MNVEKINEAIGVLREHCLGSVSCKGCVFANSGSGCGLYELPPKNWADVPQGVPHEYFYNLCKKASREDLARFTFDYDGVQYYTRFEFDRYVKPTVIRKIK